MRSKKRRKQLRLMKLNKDDYHYIKKYCENKRTLFDMQIAQKLSKTKKYKQYDNPHSLDSLRRSISFVRTYFDMRDIIVIPKKETVKNIKDLLKKYPECNKTQIAVKLKFRINKDFQTCRTYVTNYINYGSI